MTAKVWVQMFGPPATRVNGKRCSFATRKAEVLLHYLLLHPREFSRETLAQLFWPDSKDPRRQLANGLDQLRGALTGDGEAELFKGTITATRNTIQLNLTPNISADTLKFTQLLDAVVERPYIGPQERERLSQSVGLYVGPLLEGSLLEEACSEFNDWLTSSQDKFELRYLRAVRALALYDTTQGEYAQALAWLNKYLEIERHDEAVHCLVMILHVINGEPHHALRHYSRYKEVFKGTGELVLNVSATRLFHLISAGQIDDRLLQEGVRMVLTETSLAPEPSLTPLMNGILDRMDLVTRPAESEKLKRTFHRARTLARDMGFGYVGAPHIFMVLVADRHRPSIQMLYQLGLPTNYVSNSLRRVLGQGQGGPRQEIGLSPYCRHLLDLACDKAMQESAPEIAIRHLFKVILEDRRGLVPQLLELMGTEPLSPERYF